MTPAELKDLYGDESLVLRLTSSAPPLVSQVSEHNRPGGGDRPEHERSSR